MPIEKEFVVRTRSDWVWHVDGSGAHGYNLKTGEHKDYGEMDPFGEFGHGVKFPGSKTWGDMFKALADKTSEVFASMAA